ncbi:hypothetical protein PFISCL1PPCAC_26822, partial [Pristionchus fissidentatus]
VKMFYRKCMDVEIIERDDNMEMITALKALGPFPMMGEHFSMDDSADLTDMIIKIEAQGGYAFIQAEI